MNDWLNSAMREKIMTKLKPCPGCGKADRLKIIDLVWKEFDLRCERCGWFGPSKNAPHSAKRAWNRRAKP